MSTPAMTEFRRTVSDLLSRKPLAEVPARVADLLPSLLDDPNLLTDAQRRMPPSGYGRNELFICPEDGFSILAMVWPPGISTPIHDHVTWCSLGVYAGEIRESRFCSVGVTHSPLAGTCSERLPAAVTEILSRKAGDAASLPVDAPNIHCIHNPTDQVAISIHVYGGNAQKLGPNLETIYTQAA